MVYDKIIIKGAKENNLKNIDVEIPRDYTKIDEKRALAIEKTCKIYNRELHSAVFCVPNFVKELANG